MNKQRGSKLGKLGGFIALLFHALKLFPKFKNRKEAPVLSWPSLGHSWGTFPRKTNKKDKVFWDSSGKRWIFRISRVAVQLAGWEVITASLKLLWTSLLTSRATATNYGEGGVEAAQRASILEDIPTQNERIYRKMNSFTKQASGFQPHSDDNNH